MRYLVVEIFSRSKSSILNAHQRMYENGTLAFVDLYYHSSIHFQIIWSHNKKENPTKGTALVYTVLSLTIILEEYRTLRTQPAVAFCAQ